ncbi:esterase/lipase family protein [Lysobacter korlensis]|uniref:Esterase/lipase family protein n=1 Tax=Lysobacter korlensis TaxID=553636 RepID=A0ABV6RMQ3_9GAMM
MRNPLSWVSDYLYATDAQVRHIFGRSDTRRFITGTKAPVMLLPGVYESWQFMRHIAERLNADGHPVHVVHTLGFNIRSVPDGAKAAQRYLRENDLTDVRLVAHSKGGLIGKHMMVVDDREKRIDRMITINTPFAGSPYARFALGRTLREFHPSAATLTMLGKELEANRRITSLYSEADQYIPGGSPLQGAENVPLPFVGHFRVLAYPRVIDEVAKRM